MADFKDRLKELREEKRLSKWDVASALSEKASPHTIRKYETEGVNSKVHNIIELANYFNVTTDYLLGISNVKKVDLNGVSNEELLAELERRLNLVKRL